MGLDPNDIDATAAFEEAEAIGDYLEQSQEEEEAQEAVRQQNEVEETQALATQNDPRNTEDGWGLKGVAEELKSVVAGGLQDTASSITTFGERTADALTGEIARERKEKGYYRPEWDPFVDHNNPIVTKSWWGKLLRGTVHFGTMAAAIIPAAKFTAARLGISAATGLAANSLVRAAGVGAVSDLVSKESDGHNALGALTERYGWMDTPLTTKDTDHPIVMKLKNIVEGMGIGLIFDSSLMLLGRGNKAVQARIAERGRTVEVETLRKGIQEVRRNEFGFRAAKNKPIAAPEQGATLSIDDPYVVWQTQKKIRNTWGAEEGSAGNITTPVQRERIARESAISEDLVDETLRKLYSNEKYQKVLKTVGNSRRKLVEVFGDAVAAHQRITLGRNAADMPAEEYLKELFESFDVFDSGTPQQIQTIASRNVVVADLVVGTLLQQVRDLGISGREISNWADLSSKDGPLDQIVDTMLTALSEAKKARIVKSQNFRELGAGKRRFLDETLTKEMSDTRESIQSILGIANKSDDDNLLMSLFEAFSSMQTVNTLDDFDAWARKMVQGGEIEGKQQIGAAIRELEGVMIHSILSGPKTPMRAIMGTSTATFLRPLSMTLGAAMQYPFTKDAVTLRAGLASINAMMEAIPESFSLFRSKLNSYWTGDIATIKTRFAEYTRGDDNWEIIRRWHEDSGRANAGDKAVFAMANMARNLNNNNFLTYSTKIMAATDDAFAYILGRAKMREKAFRSAADAQQKGVLTAYDNITPELVRVYEEDFYRQIFDANGDIIDEATKFARKEVTLTQDLTGFAGGLNQVFQANPWAKPFFLFAKTGVNGLALTAKHTPIINFAVKEFNDIAFATVKNVEAGDLAKYGISTATELANAKALQTGRLGIGSALTSMAIWSWMSGNLTGNGPIDRQKRQVWLDAGYKPRTIKLGELTVGYDSIEPFNQILATIADIGDASQLMGEEWTEKQLLKVSLLLAQGITSKSYLAGMQQFVDLFGGRPGQAERIGANLLNNQIPLAGLRNELGKLFIPYTRELGSGIDQAIRNRNLISEPLAGEGELPIKYDILTGRPLKAWDPMTRMFNAFSPIHLNLTVTPGRKLLFDSGYDLRLSTYYGPDGTNLTDKPRIRSMFQQAIGSQNLERQLDKLATDPKILASLAQMQKDIQNGLRGDYQAIDYYHNKKIDRLFTKARKRAWGMINNNPLVLDAIAEQTGKKVNRRKKVEQTRNILSIYK
tara:strand:- start:782 stop:4480 length:3699 start_codon:yes stop_codon:yes gene_type:complete